MSTILVTGATGGIGRHAAFALAERGHRVIATGRSTSRVVALRGEIESRGSAIDTLELDVTDDASIAALAQDLPEQIDVVVHAAGIAELGPLLLVTDAALRRHFETNVFGAMAVNRVLLPKMKRRGKGRIVHLTSVVDAFTYATHGAYGASMYALRALNDVLRQELAGRGIEVVLVAPGTVRTPFIRDAFGGLDAKRWSGSRWNPVIDRLQRLERTIARSGLDPEEMGRTLADIATGRRAPRRVDVGRVPSTIERTAARVLPTRAFDGLVRRALAIAPPRPEVAESERPAVLITGAAGGIGSAATQRLARTGYRVFATDIDGQGLESLRDGLASEQLSIETLELDITDRKSVKQARRVIRESCPEGLEVLVNNAGYAELGPLDALPTEAYRRQFEVNVYGLMNVTRAFGEDMCERGRGRIVNVSSLAGLVGLPFMGVYASSKFAVEALSDALRQELGPFGVDVVIVEPSFIRTGFADTARATLDEVDASEWQTALGNVDAVLGRMDRIGGDAEDVAEAIHDAIRVRRPKARYPVPRSARIVAPLLGWVPAAVSDRVLARMFSL